MPDVGLCRDCRWWGDGFSKPASDGTQECMRVRQAPSLASLSYETQYAESRIFTFLWTAPDFGCVMFEPKEPA